MRLKIALTILLVLAYAVLYWLICVPEPVRVIPEQPTEAKKQEIRKAIKKYGDYPIVEENGRMVMMTSYGRVNLR